MASVSTVEPVIAASAHGIDAIFEAQRQNRARVASTTAAERIEKIRRVERALMARRDEIRKAMWDDFRKPAPEVDLSEVYVGLGEARHARRHLGRWMRPHRVAPSLALLGTSSRIRYEAKGVVLIISPWNFPFNLTFGPLISAIAAGNCIIVKPSELTPASSACMRRIIGDLFEENEIAVIEGDAAVATELLKKPFDHIFFTGGSTVGRIVMRAAAEHLSSVTLELGGKSPVVVDRTANLDHAARRIAWGKLLNSGQTCIAPDYLLVDETIREPFLAKLRKAIDAMSGEASRGIIVNERHGNRVRKLFDSAIASGAQVLAGGGFGEDIRKVPATVLGNVAPDSPIMHEEIFGPILPLITYGTIDEAVEIINSKPNPLVMYIFSEDRGVVDDLIERTRAGDTVINHTLIHFFQLNLPFGGAGESGIGKAHGFAGFQSFSNARGILEQSWPFSTIEMLFPPYTRLTRKLIDLTLKWL